MPDPRIAQIAGLAQALADRPVGATNLGNPDLGGLGLYAGEADGLLQFFSLRAGNGFLGLEVRNGIVDLALATGTGANAIVQLDPQSRLPAVSAALLFDIPVTKLVGARALPLSLLDLPANNVYVGGVGGTPVATPIINIPLSAFGAPNKAIQLNEYKIRTTAGSFAADELVSRAYVDAVATGVSPKAPVLLMTDTNINLSSPGHALGGVSLSPSMPNRRVLVNAQDAGVENGIYDWIDSISPMVRSADSDNESDLAAGEVFVSDGTYAGQKWRLQNKPPFQLEVTPLKYFQTYATLDYLNGPGLSLVGRTFSVLPDNVTLGLDNTNRIIVRSSATAGQVLRSTGVAGTGATWAALDLGSAASFTGYLPFSRGGTGLGVLSRHSLVGAISSENVFQGLSVADDRIVGRIAGSNIQGLDRSQIQTLLGLRPKIDSGYATAGQQTLIGLTQVPSAADTVAVFINGQLIPRGPMGYTIESGSLIRATSALNADFGGTTGSWNGIRGDMHILVFYFY